MTTHATSPSQTLLRRHVALPQDHGSWVFLLSPLLIGLFAGDAWNGAGVLLIVAAMSAFLVRQPVTVLTKIYSGRRPKRELPAAWFWTLVYGLVGLAAAAGLVLLGHTSLLYLALPALPVFTWHLALVSRRQERRQVGIELLGAGVLALAAPAAMWVGQGQPSLTGWLLWALTWLQSSASIVYAYLRLEQRVLPAIPPMGARFQMALPALLFTTFNLLLALGLALAASQTGGPLAGAVPALLWLPYAIQSAETLWGTVHPAVGFKPTRIGVRQLVVSTLFTLAFILVWIA